MPAIRIYFEEDIPEEEIEELKSDLKSIKISENEELVEMVKYSKDKSIEIGTIIIFALKVLSISIPLIKKIITTLKNRKKKQFVLRFKCGEPKKEVEIEGNMTSKEITKLITKICG